MTHSSFSEENNKALSILGASTIETSVSLQYLKKDIEASAKDLNRRISEISQVESSCAVDAMRLGLQKVIRVSPRPMLQPLQWFVVLLEQSLVPSQWIPGNPMMQERFSGVSMEVRLEELLHFMFMVPVD
ncbi:Protein nuclear fusion defective 2 [Vitis vinifera]|uniref:Protein nuclear fusion defective 2 n=1 Tax=Vitis vinifera TaxID=29760 RepID=A0A438EYW8_VITVI|nr:Protein nuclear fusion defective 2 [Vitis vinifera]